MSPKRYHLCRSIQSNGAHQVDDFRHLLRRHGAVDVRYARPLNGRRPIRNVPKTLSFKIPEENVEALRTELWDYSFFVEERLPTNERTGR